VKTETQARERLSSLNREAFRIEGEWKAAGAAEGDPDEAKAIQSRLSHVRERIRELEWVLEFPQNT